MKTECRSVGGARLPKPQPSAAGVLSLVLAALLGCSMVDGSEDEEYCHGVRALPEPVPCVPRPDGEPGCWIAWCPMSEACPSAWGFTLCSEEERRCQCAVAVEYSPEIRPCVSGDAGQRYDTDCCLSVGECCQDVGDTNEDGRETDWVGNCGT